MSALTVAIALIVLACTLAIYCFIRRKKKESSEGALEEATRASREAVDEMRVRGEMLSAKADDLGKRVDRLTDILEVTTNLSSREPNTDEEEDSKRRSASRRRRSE